MNTSDNKKVQKMRLSISEVAKLIKVDRGLIKTWTSQFAEYLNPMANPDKGTPRQFIPSDVSILAYISYYWDDNPDFEYIKSGLNASEHKEYPFSEVVSEIIPFFMEPPDELNETWRHGSLRGTFGNYMDRFSLAEEYKLAGDLLVQTSIENDIVYDVLAPIVYNYRHSTELYLKAILKRDGEQNSHNLNNLFQQLKNFLKTKLNAETPPWFDNLILSFHQFDPSGTSFRYEGPDPFGKEGELWVDIRHLKKLMDRLSESFRKIKKCSGGSVR